MILLTFPCMIKIIMQHKYVHKKSQSFSGLDDLRDWTNNVQPSVPIYTAERDFEVLTRSLLLNLYCILIV